MKVILILKCMLKNDDHLFHLFIEKINCIKVFIEDESQFATNILMEHGFTSNTHKQPPSLVYLVFH